MMHLSAVVAASRSLSRKMSSARSIAPTHMERTRDSMRSKVVSDVTVLSVEQMSPTVKSFTLRVNNKNLSFRPGQWVDLHIPAEDVVGGYSITSSPHQLRGGGTLSLAIQYSIHPPTLWMSTKCKVGDELTVRVGGDFWYYPVLFQEIRPLLLIGGGVGVNPLFSMLQHQAWLMGLDQRGGEEEKEGEGRRRREGEEERREGEEEEGRGDVQLLYSSRNVSELLFKDKIDAICREHCGIHAQYFVTKDTSQTKGITSRRLTLEDVSTAVSKLDRTKLHCYICGPPPMTEDVVKMLRTCGIDQDRLFTEKWW